ncbi:reverse transcriptase, partial [Trifolium medium]|nr:reverse transcriptase [Trifolium medium]
PMVAIANQVNWQSVHQDVKPAFVNGKLEGEVYVEQSQGFKVKVAEDKILKQQEEFELMVDNKSATED